MSQARIVRTEAWPRSITPTESMEFHLLPPGTWYMRPGASELFFKSNRAAFHNVGEANVVVFRSDGTSVISSSAGSVLCYPVKAVTIMAEVATMPEEPAF